jgi:hypothetical protein
LRKTICRKRQQSGEETIWRERENNLERKQSEVKERKNKFRERKSKLQSGEEIKVTIWRENQTIRRENQ